ncbi:hypothetical protein C9439_01305 [archaeon SCG-AAA382B04]|nr:hypothetical protein C9439_01305 [archaeon SCG-AAA382B04]
MKIDYKNNALIFPKKKFCIISDLHIGLEDKLINQGISFPFKEIELLKNNLKEILSSYEIEKVVYNGDILHEFSGVPYAVPQKLDKILALETQHVFINGSHDTMLDALLDKRDFVNHQFILEDEVAITHGDKEIEELKNRDYQLLVVGHDHPSLEIHGEKKDCFLKQEKCYKNKDVLITPAFSRLSEGIRVNELSSTDLMSPYLESCRVGDFEVIIEVENEVLHFPKLREFREKL